MRGEILDNNISIVSLKDFPEFRDLLIDYVQNSTVGWLKPFTQIVDEVFWGKNELPKCYLMLKDNKIVGYYQLVKLELIIRKDLSPWITCVFIDEQERGGRLSSQLLKHGRTIAGKLGYPKVYLTTDHIQFYEKFGFREIGLDKFITGRSTKIYENDTIR
jgi:GNAT superfamily N-acetyltransferase